MLDPVIVVYNSFAHVCKHFSMENQQSEFLDLSYLHFPC